MGESMQNISSRLTRLDLRDQLAALINEIAKIESEKITENATVDEDLQMNSVAFVELQVAIEEEYHIEIDPIQLVEINRFGDIIDYIHSCIVNQGS